MAVVVMKHSVGNGGAYCSVGIAASFFADSVCYVKVFSNERRECLVSFRFRDVCL